MPYIEKNQRKKYDNTINVINFFLEKEGFPVGDITYIFYKILLFWWQKNKSYKTICAIRGVLSGTMDEFNRREAHNYENNKIKENGDV
jgi:hypothetical protein